MLADFRKKVPDAKGRAPGVVVDLSVPGPLLPLVAFLTEVAYPDKKPRETGTMLVFAELGQMKCCLTDRDTGLRCFVTASGWVELLERASAAVDTGEGDWRPVQGKGRRS